MAKIQDGEDVLLRRLRRRSPGRFLGDDAAILPAGEWAVTMDSQIEGVHFPSGLDPAVCARRLLAVNLSDLAAMGAAPRFAFLALSTPPSFDHQRFFDALVRAGDRLGLVLAGGDLARHSVVTTSLTLLGERPPEGKWLRRGAARPGDRIWLGGTVGESAAGCELARRGATFDGRRVEIPETLGDASIFSSAIARAARRAVRRHFEPLPQLELGRALGRCRRAAAIDLSDGLARDLHRLCEESGVGAEIEMERIPLADRFAALAAHLGKNPEHFALGGGEDYVLLFALPEDVAPPRPGCVEIGRATKERRLILRKSDGESVELEAAGWDHLKAV